MCATASSPTPAVSQGAVVCEIENFRDLPAYVETARALEGEEGADVLHRRNPLRKSVRVAAQPRIQRRLPTARRHRYLPGAVRERALAGRMFRLRSTHDGAGGRRRWCRSAVARTAAARRAGLSIACTTRVTSSSFLRKKTERENRDYRLCPECLAGGITFETAEYPKARARRGGALVRGSACSSRSPT